MMFPAEHHKMKLRNIWVLPINTYTLKSGGQVWSYDDCYGGVSGSDGRVTGGMSCVKFVLTFDEKGILRNWVRQ
jgi:hypothetical protein